MPYHTLYISRNVESVLAEYKKYMKEKVSLACMLTTDSGLSSSKNALEPQPTHAHYPSSSMHSIPFLLQNMPLHASVSLLKGRLPYQDYTPVKVQGPAASDCNFGSAL
jgi:hypothetical protein